jgi:hypothetical protein
VARCHDGVLLHESDGKAGHRRLCFVGTASVSHHQRGKTVVTWDLREPRVDLLCDFISISLARSLT